MHDAEHPAWQEWMCGAMQVLELVIDRQDSSLRITVLHDLGTFPQWTMDARTALHQPPGVTTTTAAIIGLSDNSIGAFSCARDGQAAARQLWTAGCTEELLLYSMALHVAGETVFCTPSSTSSVFQVPKSAIQQHARRVMNVAKHIACAGAGVGGSGHHIPGRARLAGAAGHCYD